VVHALAADPRIEFAFTASEAPGLIRSIHAGAPPGSRLVSHRLAALRKWDAYLTSDFMWAMLPRGTRRVQMFHGVAGKYGFDAPGPEVRAWHRLFFINTRRRDNFIASGAIDADSPAVRLVGMPKVDCLVDGSLRRDDVLRQEGIDPSRPVVLYAPTWSAASSLNRLGMALIEALMRLPVTVMVKLHDRSYDPRPIYSGGVDWRSVLQPILDRGHGRLLAGTDVTPYLAAADVMITDHSSAGFEYLLLDRPLVRIEVPELLRLAHVHADYVRLLTDVSVTASSVAGVVRSVERALGQPLEGSAARRRVASELFFQPGTASVRAGRELSDLLELPVHQSLVDREQKARTCLQMA
jgi:hypothetical protein